MTYYLCSAKDHYVSSHRGEALSAGAVCPSGDCRGRLRPAPEKDDVTRCPGCSRGLLLPTEVDGRAVELCSFCGQSRLVRSAEDVPVPKRAMTGAERVAAYRARKRAAAA